MADLSPAVQAVVDQTTQAALQAGQQVASLQMQNAVHIQQLAQTASLQLLTGGMQVGQAYQGSHLRRGSELDVQESVAEGAGYKGEAESDLAAQMAQLQAVLSSMSLQIKGVQSTPPQTGGYAAEAPGARAPSA